MPLSELFLLDTHVWLDVAFGRSSRFAMRVRRQLEVAAQTARLYVAAITPWEVAMLVRNGKVRVSSPVLDFLVGALRETRTAVAPLEPTIAVDAVELPAWEHRDPANRLIVASARYMDALLLTRDASILEYASDVKGVRVIDPSR
ncbi:MAG: type II toxin-antitoxin system VapC family toxin [Myxococcota bacterium]|nr:type II toxin-antitoxin system VapC family toxin [Myxococcota bacterium]